MSANAVLPTPGSMDRRPPQLSAVLREELQMVGERVTQGRPLVTILPAILVTVYFARESMWGLVPLLAGVTYGPAMWSNRAFGRTVGWELPVSRLGTNVIRNFAGLSWSMATGLALAALGVLLAVEVNRLEPVAGMLTAAGAAILGFAIFSALWQLTSPQRRYLFPVGMMAVLPFFMVPYGFLFRILPDVVRPIFSGRFGLGVFTGKILFELSRAGFAPSIWNLGDWLISAAIWISLALGLLLLVSSRYQE